MDNMPFFITGILFFVFALYLRKNRNIRIAIELKYLSILIGTAMCLSVLGLPFLLIVTVCIIIFINYIVRNRRRASVFIPYSREVMYVCIVVCILLFISMIYQVNQVSKSGPARNHNPQEQISSNKRDRFSKKKEVVEFTLDGKKYILSQYKESIYTIVIKENESVLFERTHDVKMRFEYTTPGNSFNMDINGVRRKICSTCPKADTKNKNHIRFHGPITLDLFLKIK